MFSKLGKGLGVALCEPLVLFSVLLGSLGVWILVPEILIGGSPFSEERAAQWSQSRIGPFRVVSAARIAVIRGDLWTDAAQLFDRRVQMPTADSIKDISAGAKTHLSGACRNALSLAPISSRLWAVCAPYCGDQTPSVCTTRYIQMAYFTGPYRLESIPDRLRVAMTIDFRHSPDTKMLVAEDIRYILRQEPDLLPALRFSYQNALASNKPAILVQIQEIDPAFAATLR